MQWIGALGVLLIVQTGYVVGVGLGWQSKHSVSNYQEIIQLYNSCIFVSKFCKPF